jgi:hypothetical protein
MQQQLIAKEEVVGDLQEQLRSKEEQLKRTLGSKKVCVCLYMCVLVCVCLCVRVCVCVCMFAKIKFTQFSFTRRYYNR